MKTMTLKECCCFLKRLGHPSRIIQHAILASETSFSINEIEALYDLFERLSYAIIEDGRIHKEEFRLALFSNSSMQNLFVQKKCLSPFGHPRRNGVYCVDEIVSFANHLPSDAPRIRSNESIVNSQTLTLYNIVAVMFRLYDLRHTGFIEREELKEMVVALLSEMDVSVSDEDIEAILDKTIYWMHYLNGDGKIDLEEWKIFISKNPSILKNMTLPLLRCGNPAGAWLLGGRSAVVQLVLQPSAADALDGEVLGGELEVLVACESVCL
ncbi:calcineurin B-like protein 7 [Tanacetum coccineum]